MGVVHGILAFVRMLASGAERTGFPSAWGSSPEAEEIGEARGAQPPRLSFSTAAMVCSVAVMSPAARG
jgi:hypothetical protein